MDRARQREWLERMPCIDAVREPKWTAAVILSTGRTSGPGGTATDRLLSRSLMNDRLTESAPSRANLWSECHVLTLLKCPNGERWCGAYHLTYISGGW